MKKILFFLAFITITMTANAQKIEFKGFAIEKGDSTVKSPFNVDGYNTFVNGEVKYRHDIGIGPAGEDFLKLAAKNGFFKVIVPGCRKYTGEFSYVCLEDGPRLVFPDANAARRFNKYTKLRTNKLPTELLMLMPCSVPRA